jgi:4-aminobutyrate aminotransferase / (S)-3-amino-2-methylpropionate transaminase / 5-aminovalerate transaminase
MGLPLFRQLETEGVELKNMSVIRRVTDIPGPKATAILARERAAIPRGMYHAVEVVVESARGSVVEDVDGNRFIDFAGGIGTLNTGHSHPAVVAAVREQSDRLVHMCFAVAPYSSYITLAERLAQLTPGKFAKKVMFANSGAEAVENAIKIARHASKRPAILCFEDAFHGRTLTALALTSKIHPYKEGMGPFDTAIFRVPYAYCYRCSYHLTYPECGVGCVDSIEAYFSRYVEPQSIAAVIVEPVLGEGGFVVPPREFLKKLGELCRRYGILTIADEIQTGIGRTGRMFASEHYDFVPDLLLTAKSLAGGLPLSAVIGRAEIMDSPGLGGLGGTFGGNPLALAAAHAVLDVVEKEVLLERAEEIGARIETRAKSWAERFPLVGEVRRLGAMVGIELVRDRETREPAKKETAEVLKMSCKEGVIVLSAGTYGNVIRFLPPLVMKDEELEEGLAVVERCLEAVSEALATMTAKS